MTKADDHTKKLIATLRDMARASVRCAENARSYAVSAYLRKAAQQDLSRAAALERGEPDPLSVS